MMETSDLSRKRNYIIIGVVILILGIAIALIWWHPWKKETPIVNDMKVTFEPNGSAVTTKLYHVVVNVKTDATNGSIKTLKYLWSASANAPAKESFSSSFINGETITTPEDINSDYYLWIYAEDKAGKVTITRSSSFKIGDEGINNNSTTISGRYLYSVKNFEGTKPWIEFKIDKTFTMEVNGCEGMIDLAGNYSIEGNSLTLNLVNNNNINYSGVEGVTSYSLSIKNDNELTFLSSDVACAPLRNSSFTKEAVSTTKTLNGKYTYGVTDFEGTKPWIEFKIDKTFTMKVNGCEGMIDLAGNYSIEGNSLTLNLVNNNNINYSGVEGVTSYSLSIKNDNELTFLSSDVACAPLRNSNFIKN